MEIPRGVAESGATGSEKRSSVLKSLNKVAIYWRTNFSFTTKPNAIASHD